MIITKNFFNRMIQFIKNNTGIEMPDTNHQLIKRFVSERLSSLKMKPDTYLLHVKENKDEYYRFIDAVTINETYFFREEKHFMLMDSFIFPRYANTNQDHLKFWSAACSTGEEAVSIAALAEKFWGKHSENAYTVFASDLNPIALDFFKRGSFGSNSFRKDGSSFHYLLNPFIRNTDARHCLENTLKQKIQICHLNLLHDDFSKLHDNIDIVFLRNILIYIPIETRHKILDKIVRKMRVGGYLLLSSSETPLVSHQELKLVEKQGVYFFQKKQVYDKKYGYMPNQNLIIESSKKNFSEKLSTHSVPMNKKNNEGVNIEEVIFFVNQKMNNSLSDVKDNINYSLAKQFREIVSLISSNQFSKARELLKSVINITVEDEISYYLSGYMYMAEQNEEKAIHQFSRSLKCNASFWISRFYMGMLLQKILPRKARIEFELCQRSIISYIEKDSYSYEFLLEGFNVKYFLEICRKWNNKLIN